MAGFPAQAAITILVFSVILSTSSYAVEIPDNEHTPRLSEMGLEDLLDLKVEKVSGASSYEQAVTEAPSSISIVTSENIKMYGWRTVADILNATRGFFTTYDRNYSYIGVRGFSRPGDYNSRVLMLVDGHRINDLIFETAPIGTDFGLDLALIDRIEIIRGPSSSLYGTGAFFGVINIITRSGDKIDGLETSASGGSQDTYSGRVTFGKKFETGEELVLSGSRYSSRGDDRLFYPEFSGIHNGIAADMDRDRSYSFFGKAAWRDLTLSGAFSSRDKKIPTASFNTVFNDPRTHGVDARNYIDLRFDRDIADTGILARLFYDEYTFRGEYPLSKDIANDPSYYPSIYVNRDDLVTRWWGGELQASRQILPRMHIVAGGKFRDNFQMDLTNYDVTDQGRRIDNSRRNIFWALYGQAELRLLDSLILNAGIRYDHYQTFGGATSPRLAVIYTPVEKNVLKLIYGESFRAPNGLELYYNDAVNSTLQNPKLKPETIRTYELIHEYYFDEMFRTSASFFYNEIDKLISYQSNGSQVYFDNIDKVKTIGGEFEVEGHFSCGAIARTSYTYVDAVNDSTDQKLDYSPQHLAKLNISIPLYRKNIFGSLEIQGVSRREFVLNEIKSASAGYAVTNFTLFSKGLVSGLEMSGSIYNILDKRYDDPATPDHLQNLIRQDGRSFRVQLTYRF